MWAFRIYEGLLESLCTAYYLLVFLASVSNVKYLLVFFSDS